MPESLGNRGSSRVPNISKQGLTIYCNFNKKKKKKRAHKLVPLIRHRTRKPEASIARVRL